MSRPDEALIVLHAPGYGPIMHRPDIVHRAESTGADSIGWSEANRIAGRVLHNRPDYRAFCGKSDVDTRRIPNPMGDAGDTVISVRDDHRILAKKAERITHPGPLRFLKWTPERWGTVVTYDHPQGPVTHINIHPSPVFTGHRKWRKVIDWALRKIRSARAAGNHVVLTGDLQTKRLIRGILAEVGLSSWNVGVDWLAWSNGLQLVSTREIRVDGLDHPWLCGVFASRS
jgi:hypothetical protein